MVTNHASIIFDTLTLLYECSVITNLLHGMSHQFLLTDVNNRDLKCGRKILR